MNSKLLALLMINVIVGAMTAARGRELKRRRDPSALTGTAAIHGTDYALSAGFQKLASSDNVRVGLVLRPVLDEETALLLFFGEPVPSADGAPS